jgi:hypothetical protein
VRTRSRSFGGAFSKGQEIPWRDASSRGTPRSGAAAPGRARRHLSDALVVRRAEREVLADRIQVAPAALDRRARLERVHACGTADQFDAVQQLLRRRQVGETQPHEIGDGRRRARTHALEELAADGLHVGPRAVE